jgi:NADH dehydrogenase [ubiquinone] 1 alpha subcomplex assembly factor 6
MTRTVNSRIAGAEHRGALSPLAALVRRHDRDRFQTTLFAPAAHREALFSLYAFNYEVARVRESVREPMLGQIRLQWWRESIATAFAGGAPRAHPVAEAIAETIRARGLSRTLFDHLIDTRERDLDGTPPASLAALEDYAEGTAATLLYVALEILKVEEASAREAARHVGIAYGLSGIVRAIPFQASFGRTLMDTDLSVRTVAQSAAAHLAAARGMRRAVPAAAVPALLGARVAEQTLRRLERAGFDPFAATPDDPMQSWRLAYARLTGRF